MTGRRATECRCSRTADLICPRCSEPVCASCASRRLFCARCGTALVYDPDKFLDWYDAHLEDQDDRARDEAADDLERQVYG